MCPSYGGNGLSGRLQSRYEWTESKQRKAECYSQQVICCRLGNCLPAVIGPIAVPRRARPRRRRLPPARGPVRDDLLFVAVDGCAGDLLLGTERRPKGSGAKQFSLLYDAAAADSHCGGG